MTDRSKPSQARAALRIAARLVLLGVAVAVTVPLMGIAGGDGRNDYYSALIDKHVRLAAMRSPKLVIVGGSSAAFGVDSRAIEAVVGMPVFNMGLGADLGLPFMLREIEKHLAAGDRVLLMPEYELFQGDGMSDAGRHYAMSYLPDSWDYVESPADYVRYFLRATVLKAQRTVRVVPEKLFGGQPEKSGYSRELFDASGDYVGHLGKGVQFDTAGWDATPRPVFELNSKVIARLEEFVTRVRQRGVVVLVANPPLYERYYGRNIVNVTRVDSMLRRVAHRTGMVVLSRPTDFLFTLDSMYDGPYHLNARGRAERTRRLIQALRSTHMAPASNPPEPDAF